MNSQAQKETSKPRDSGLFVSAFPPLQPSALFARRRAPQIYPFNDPRLEYFYYARNGIYALARSWKLDGQEVLFPAYFHGVELEALVAAGVVPRFYPVHKGMRVDPEEVKSLITRKTQAIYLIHYVGFPGPVREIADVCRSRNLLLVEDCALALLSRNGSVPLGTVGDAAIFCLYKTLPLPNGGAVLIQGPGLHRLDTPCPSSIVPGIAYSVSLLSSNFKFPTGGLTHRLVAMLRRQIKTTTQVFGIAEVGTQHFDLSLANTGMSKLGHWILAAQDFDQIIERRRCNFLHLLQRLQPFCEPVFTQLSPGVCPLFFPIHVRQKETVVERLFSRGIQAVNLWSAYHPLAPPGMYPEVDELRRSVLEIPCHQGITGNSVDRMADEVIAVLSLTGRHPAPGRSFKTPPSVSPAPKPYPRTQ
ncbi:MAG TPA: DegT/DnrJ/EryC1/StrS family aminotransferase [Terriglobia bacterium]|nr:DegT/DnrJ/EryC1/StrS family aminotransferase [Terriglobia bacterium]